jgi:hypothetical protein
MKYVYLVYEECHGLIGVCGTPEAATKMVNDNAIEYGMNPTDQLSVYGDGIDGYGWDETYWRREEVLY